MPHIFILVLSMAKTAFKFAYSRFSHMLVRVYKLVLWSVLKHVSQRRNRACHMAGRPISLVFFFRGSRHSAISPPLCNSCDLKLRPLFVIQCRFRPNAKAETLYNRNVNQRAQTSAEELKFVFFIFRLRSRFYFFFFHWHFHSWNLAAQEFL